MTHEILWDRPDQLNCLFFPIHSGDIVCPIWFSSLIPFRGPSESLHRPAAADLSEIPSICRRLSLDSVCLLCMSSRVPGILIGWSINWGFRTDTLPPRHSFKRHLPFLCDFSLPVIKRKKSPTADKEILSEKRHHHPSVREWQLIVHRRTN